MKLRIVLLLALIATGSGLSAREWYAASSAMSGNGSITNPWSLFSALQTNAIQPGDTLNLRGGSYAGPGFVSTLNGTSNAPIVVRSQPGEWAILTDGLQATLHTTLSNNPSNTWVVITGLERLSAGALPDFYIASESFRFLMASSPTNFLIQRGLGSYIGDGSLTPVTNHSIGDRLVLHAAYFTDMGNYVWYRDFEIAGNATNRLLTDSNWMGSGFNMANQNVGEKLINLVIHNTGHPGIGAALQLHDVDAYEINGCLVFGTGVYYSWNANQVVGSGMYLENQGNLADVKNCIMFRNFTANAKFFGEGGDVHNQRFLTNISFLSGLTPLQISSGSLPSSNTWMNGNIMMGSPNLSYQSVSNTAQYFINNIVVNGGFGVTDTYNSVYTNNTVFFHNTGTGGNTYDGINFAFKTMERTNLNLVWDFNNYYVDSNAINYGFSFACSNVSSGLQTCAGWTNLSQFDKNSTYQATWPTNYLKASFQRLDYDSNQWHIAVVSTSGQTNTSIALADYGFENGDRYRLVDAQNWPVMVASGTYAGGTINLPLNRTNVSAIPGVAHFTNEHTNVKNPCLFNVFVLRRIPRPAPPANLWPPVPH